MNGKLILQVLKPEGWSSLQPFAYDDADKFNTRKAVERRAKRALMRWQDNYHQYRDATFRIVDSAIMPAYKLVKKTKVEKPAVAPTNNWPEGVSVMTLDKDNFNPAALYSFVGKAIGEL